MRLVFIIFITCSTVLLASTELLKKTCNHEYKEIWNLYQNGLKEQTQKRLDSCVFTNEIASDSMSLLQARLYYENKKYHKALSTIELVKEHITSRYYSLKNSPHTEENLYAISLYYIMLAELANANYMIAKYENSLKYYSKLIAIQQNVEPYIYEYAGFSSYHLKKYEQAKEYFQDAYKLYANEYKKMACAYNIGGIYSKLNSIEKSLIWFQKAMMHHLKYSQNAYVDQMYLDSDYNNLKSSEDFLNYIKSLE